jgi:hypothetical protein
MKKRGIDAMLDEIDEARRKIRAERGNDWRKVLDYYVEVGKKNPKRVVQAPRPVGEEPSAAVDQDRLRREQRDGEKMPEIEDKSPAVSGL